MRIRKPAANLEDIPGTLTDLPVVSELRVIQLGLLRAVLWFRTYTLFGSGSWFSYPFGSGSGAEKEPDEFDSVSDVNVELFLETKL